MATKKPATQKRSPQVTKNEATNETETKRGRASKPAYPNIPEGGLKSVPKDYDVDKYRKLGRKDFANVETYKAFKASVSKLEQYPIPEGGLTEIPADWNRKKHMPLEKDNFSEQKQFLHYSFQANELRAKADRLDRKAKAEESVAKIGDAKKAKQLVSTLQRLKELQEALGAEVIGDIEKQLGLGADSEGADDADDADDAS